MTTTTTRSMSAPASQPSKSRSAIETKIELPAVRAFLLYLASERGLADNSLHAYRRDLEDISEYFARRGTDLIKANAEHYRGYLQNQTRQGQSTKTVARRLAAIRVFLRYQAAE